MTGINSTSTLSGVDHSSCDYFKENKSQQNNFTTSVAKLKNTSAELARNNGSSSLPNNTESPDIAEPGYAYFQEKKEIIRLRKEINLAVICPRIATVASGQKNLTWVMLIINVNQLLMWKQIAKMQMCRQTIIHLLLHFLVISLSPRGWNSSVSIKERK